MDYINKLLNIIIDEAIEIGFPISDKLERKIFIDNNEYSRVGACYRYSFPERYEIHLSEATTKADVKYIKDIIAHEVIHSNFLTMEHNCFWNMYKDKMNKKYGYNIKLTYSWNEILK